MAALAAQAGPGKDAPACASQDPAATSAAARVAARVVPECARRPAAFAPKLRPASSRAPACRSAVEEAARLATPVDAATAGPGSLAHALEPPEQLGHIASLLVQCPDQKGVIAALAQLLYGLGCNIIESDQYTDTEVPPSVLPCVFAGTPASYREVCSYLADTKHSKLLATP